MFVIYRKFLYLCENITIEILLLTKKRVWLVLVWI